MAVRGAELTELTSESAVHGAEPPSLYRESLGVISCGEKVPKMVVEVVGWRDFSPPLPLPPPGPQLGYDNLVRDPAPLGGPELNACQGARHTLLRPWDSKKSHFKNMQFLAFRVSENV